MAHCTCAKPACFWPARWQSTVLETTHARDGRHRRIINPVKAGSTVLLEFELLSGSTEMPGTSAVASFKQAAVSRSTTAVIDDVEETSNGGTSLRYDTTSGQSIQNWQTPKTAGSGHEVTMTSADGSTISTLFKLKGGPDRTIALCPCRGTPGGGAAFVSRPGRRHPARWRNPAMRPLVPDRLPGAGPAKEHTTKGALPMRMKLELVPIPVSDVDRAIDFYENQLGFHKDVDVRPTDGVRVVQLTPPGSACSVGFGTGLDVYAGEPGSIRGLHLVVQDLEQARAELIDRGVDVGSVHDFGGGVRGANFSDPDGNTFELQEMAWRTGPQF